MAFLAEAGDEVIGTGDKLIATVDHAIHIEEKSCLFHTHAGAAEGVPDGVDSGDRGAIVPKFLNVRGDEAVAEIRVPGGEAPAMTAEHFPGWFG